MGILLVGQQDEKHRKPTGLVQLNDPTNSILIQLPLATERQQRLCKMVPDKISGTFHFMTPAQHLTVSVERIRANG